MSNNPRALWDNCLLLIKENVSEQQFNTWFKPIVFESFNESNRTLLLQVSSQFVAEYIEENYAGLLNKVLVRIYGKGIRLNYRVMVDKTNNISQQIQADPVVNIEQTVTRRTRVNQSPTTLDAAQPQQIDSQLNPRHTFANYIEGDSNKLPRAVGLSIAEHPNTTQFNPMFIYGPSGCGKTHLINAIGVRTKEIYPQKRVLYISARLFQVQYTNAVLNNRTNDFINFYQTIDMLIVDDIQEWVSAAKTQETFFHIFNHLHQSGKQLILTSDRSPAELSGLEERLLSRFRWGLSAEIKAPDFETRMEIARFKAHKDGIDFSDEVLEYICKYVSNNVRELEGAMISLLAQATFNHKDLTVDVVKDILGKMVKNQKVELTVEHIQQVICNHFNMAPEMLQEKTRKREVVQARQLAMYFSKTYTNASLAYIGKQIGKKDHTTVLYACKAVTDLMETDRAFKAQVEELQKKLYCRN